MLLKAEEDVASCDSDMDCTDEGWADSCQEVSMDIDMEERSSWILPLTTLMDADKDLTVERKNSTFPIRTATYWKENSADTTFEG